MEILKDKSIKELMEIAKKRVVENVPAGTSFKVRDLFVGFQWDAIPQGNRKKMGLYFFVWADSEGGQYVTIEDKATSGQQLYTKK